MKKSLLFILTLMTYLGYAQCVDPVITDFECAAPSHPITGALVSVTNPFPGGINNSPNVGEYTDDGTNGFDNVFIDYGAAIDLASNPIFKMKLYSPSSIQILAKLEGGTVQEIYSDFSLVNTWEEFTFDFSASIGNGNTRLVLFLNPAVTDGTPTDIYYVDDLMFDAPAMPCNEPVLTNFECMPSSQPFTGALANIDNPFPGGINTSASVGEYTDDGTNGFDALVFDYGAPIDLSTNNILKLKLYSSTSIQILAKLEGGTVQEIYSDFSQVNTWEEFTFDFTGSIGSGNTRVALFFNVAVTSGTQTDLYYIDDLLFDDTVLSNPDAIFNDSITLYPNPTSNSLHISSQTLIDQFEIMDLTGKSIINDKVGISKTVDVSGLKPGIYFISLVSDNSKKILKFIKQ
ncbi:MAG: T9SS type A sorting domain-containing protein [Nonlabens sp.]